jgi:hypothetical protein
MDKETRKKKETVLIAFPKSSASASGSPDRVTLNRAVALCRHPSPKVRRLMAKTMEAFELLNDDPSRGIDDSQRRFAGLGLATSLEKWLDDVLEIQAKLD